MLQYKQYFGDGDKAYNEVQGVYGDEVQGVYGDKVEVVKKNVLAMSRNMLETHSKN